MKKHAIYTAFAGIMLAGAVSVLPSCSGSKEKQEAIAETVEESVGETAGEMSETGDPDYTDEFVTAVPGLDKGKIQKTPSGLLYVVNEEGTGASPKATDVVEVYYTGKLPNGTVFDSTELHGGEAAKFPLNQVIPGWTEGVQLMKEGGKYTFFIPSNLGYGEQGVPQAGIPANSPLIFDIELVKVDK